MPTNVITFTNDEIDMVWKEPYLTEGLNEKAMVMPKGVYRGFEVIPSGAALTVTLVAALPKNDHLAVIETQNNYSLTVRRATGNFDVSLAAYTSQTVVVSLYAIYAIGTPTTAFVRVFTQAEYNALTTAEKGELVVLATVVVPGAGVIAASAITFALRTYPWQSLSPNFLPWRELVRNGVFELGRNTDPRDGCIPYWTPNPTTRAVGATAYFRRSTTDPGVGAACLEYYQDQTGAQTNRLQQYVTVPAVPGQRVRLSWRLKRLVIPSGLTSASIILSFVDSAGAQVGTTISASLNLVGVDGAYVLSEVYGEAPATAVAVSRVEVEVVGLNYGVAGTVMFRMDSISVMLQASSVAQSQDFGLEAMNQFLHANRIVLKRGSPQPGSFTDPEMILAYTATVDPTEGQVQALPVAPPTSLPAIEAPELYWPGVINLGEFMTFDETRAQRPRITARRADSAIHPRTRIANFPPGLVSGGYEVNVYRYGDGSADERLEIVVNAVWNDQNVEWDCITPGQTASRWSMTLFGLTFEVKDTTVPSWTDANWNPSPYTTGGQGGVSLFSRLLSSDNGRLAFPNPSATGSDPSNPVGNATIATNTLYAKNIVKSFGLFLTNGSGGCTIQNDGSFNVLGFVVSATAVRITLTQPFFSVNSYSGVACIADSTSYTVKFSYPNAGYFELLFYNAAGVLIDPSTNIVGASFVVCGRQG